MSKSFQDRAMNIMRALARAVDLLGKQTLRDFSFNKNDQVLRDEIYPTTWDELVKGGFIEAKGAREILAGTYRLTPRGWTAVVELLNDRLATDLGTLCKALKTKVDGRHTHAVATVDDIVAATGLDRAFIINAIDAHLLEHHFHQTGVHWLDGDETKTMVIPVSFGHKLWSQAP